MQERFSAPQIRRRQRGALIRNLEKRGTKNAEQVATKLQEYASQVLTAPDEYTATLQISLASHVTHYRCLYEGVQQSGFWFFTHNYIPLTTFSNQFYYRR
jgi:hypothetical protein